jgi:chain length determinant protein tyrosine kinase EpsG
VAAQPHDRSDPALSEAAPRRAVEDCRRIGAILVASNRLTPAQVDEILATQRVRGTRFGETGVRLGLIGVDDLRRALAEQYDVPHLLPDNRRANAELVVASMPFHPCAEQIRAVRTRLLVRWAKGAIHGRMLAVVSPGSGEGRSYFAANLAVAFAQLGEQTLLIDAALRRPRQQRIFQVDDSVGLAAVLAGRAKGSAVVPVPEFGTLSVLPAGASPPNPLELLSRDLFAILLHELQREYQVILIDTPAAELCSDAYTVAFRAGSALVLARKHVTSVAAMDRVIAELRETGTGIAGTVFNAF